MIVLATRTFGAAGSSSQGTWEELVTAKTLKKPLFVIDMCEGNWTELATLMELGNLQRKTWTPGMDMPPSVWNGILDKLHDCGVMTSSARSLHGSNASLITLSNEDIDSAVASGDYDTLHMAVSQGSIVDTDSPTKTRVSWDDLHDMTEGGKAILIGAGLTASTGMALEDQLGYTEAEDLDCITEEMIASLTGVPPIQILKLRKLIKNHSKEGKVSQAFVRTMTHQRRLKEHQQEISKLLSETPTPDDELPKTEGWINGQLPCFNLSHFRVVSGSADCTIRTWDLEDFSNVNILQGHSEWIRCMSVSPDGKTLLSGSGDKTIKAWDTLNGRLKFTLTGHSYCVRKICITSDSSTAVSASYGKVLRVWDIHTGTFLRTLEGHKNTIHCLIMTKDSRYIVSGGDDTTVKVWNIFTGECKVTLKGHKSTITSLALTPDGRTVVSGSDDKTVRSWSLINEAVTVFAGHEKSVSRVEVCPDGKTILSGSMDSTLRVWNMDSGACIAILKGHSDFIQSLAVTRSDLGLFAVTGSHDKTLRVWDLKTMQTIHLLKGHVGAVHCVVITPDGKTIVSGSYAKRLRVWDLETGACKATIEGHAGPVNCLALIPVYN